MLNDRQKQIAWQAWCDNYNEFSNATGLYAAVEAVLADSSEAAQKGKLTDAQIESAWENYSGTPAPLPASQVACSFGCIGTCKGHAMAQNTPAPDESGTSE